MDHMRFRNTSRIIEKEKLSWESTPELWSGRRGKGAGEKDLPENETSDVQSQVNRSRETKS